MAVELEEEMWEGPQAKRLRLEDRKVVLGYWDVRGLAQPIRLVLEHIGLPYEEKRFRQGLAPDFDKSCWYGVKDEILGQWPSPNLPYLIDGEITLTQSNAILRHLGRRHGMLGASDEEAALVDVLLDEATDFRNASARLAYSPCFPSLIAGYERDYLPSVLTKFSGFLDDKSWFVAGSEPTIADFPIYELLSQHKRMVPGCLAGYPDLTAFMERFERLPRVGAFLRSRRCIRAPCHHRHAYTSQHEIC